MTTPTINIKTKTLKVNVHSLNINKAIDAFNHAQFPFIKNDRTNTYIDYSCYPVDGDYETCFTGYYTFSVTVPYKTTHKHITELFQNFGFGRLVPKQ